MKPRPIRIHRTPFNPRWRFFRWDFGIRGAVPYWNRDVGLWVWGWGIMIPHWIFWPGTYLLAFVLGFVACCILGWAGVM